MKIDENLIKRLTAIAAIDLGEEELEAQRQDLERIAAYTERISDIDTEGMPLQTHPFGVSGVSPSEINEMFSVAGELEKAKVKAAEKPAKPTVSEEAKKNGKRKVSAGSKQAASGAKPEVVSEWGEPDGGGGAREESHPEKKMPIRYGRSSVGDNNTETKIKRGSGSGGSGSGSVSGMSGSNGSGSGSGVSECESGSGSDGRAGNRLRADVLTNKDCAEALIKAAPDSKGPYIRVPRTVEN